jgi:hypothetical protein
MCLDYENFDNMQKKWFSSPISVESVIADVI